MSFDTALIGEQKTVTTAGTRELLKTGSRDACITKTLILRALLSNSGIVYVGDGTVSSTVFFAELEPGDVLVVSKTDQEWAYGEAINMAGIWLDVSVSGDGVNAAYERPNV